MYGGMVIVVGFVVGGVIGIGWCCWWEVRPRLVEKSL